MAVAVAVAVAVAAAAATAAAAAAAAGLAVGCGKGDALGGTEVCCEKKWLLPGGTLGVVAVAG